MLLCPACHRKSGCGIEHLARSHGSCEGCRQSAPCVDCKAHHSGGPQDARIRADLKSAIRRSLASITHHRYPDLERGLTELPTPMLRDLERLLRETSYELTQAKRTFRPFPGGPRIKL